MYDTIIIIVGIASTVGAIWAGRRMARSKVTVIGIVKDAPVAQEKEQQSPKL